MKMEEDEDYDLTLICTGANDSEETLPVYYEALLRAIRDTFTRCSAISIQEYMESENNAKNMTIQSLSTAYNALSADVYSQMVADPTPYMQDGGYLNGFLLMYIARWLQIPPRTCRMEDTSMTQGISFMRIQ